MNIIKATYANQKKLKLYASIYSRGGNNLSILQKIFSFFSKRRIITINILLCILSHKFRWVFVCVCVYIYIHIMCDFIYYTQIYIEFPAEGMILRYFSMVYFSQITDYYVYAS